MNTTKIQGIITNLKIDKNPVFGWVVLIDGEYTPLACIQDYDLLLAMMEDAVSTIKDTSYIAQVMNQLLFSEESDNSKERDYVKPIVNKSGISLYPTGALNKFRLIFRDKTGELIDVTDTLDGCTNLLLERFS